MVLSPEIRKLLLAILGSAWSRYGIISHLIGAADIALVLVAVVTVAVAIGVRYLEDRPQSARKVVHWTAGKEKMIMATTPEQEARHGLDHGAIRSEPGPDEPIGYERLAAPGHEGPREPRHPLTREERGQARWERRDARALGRRKRRELAAATIWLPTLGVAIRDGNVYAAELSWSGPVTGRLLGPLAWAYAEVTGGVARRPRGGGARAAEAAAAVDTAGPVGVLARVSRKKYRGVAAVAFPDGNVWKKAFTGAPALIKGQAEAVRFNILAVGAAPETRPAGNGVSSDLERLAALHASGVLDAEEFRQAKAVALSGGR